MTQTSHSQLVAMRTALQFLTVLPVSSSRAPSPAEQGLSLLWYPFVGLLIGGLLMATATVLPGPDYLQAAIVLTAWVFLTGGLHLDGLADCADAWTGGLGDRERTLELLKDPLCGAMAVLALVLTLLLKFACLTVLLAEGQWAALIAVPMLARGSLLQLFRSTPYVRQGGLGELIERHYSRGAGVAVLLLVAVAVALVMGVLNAVLLLATAMCVGWLIRRTAMRRLGGFTGDVAGAQVELLEVALLLVLALAVEW